MLADIGMADDASNDLRSLLNWNNARVGNGTWLDVSFLAFGAFLLCEELDAYTRRSCPPVWF